MSWSPDRRPPGFQRRDQSRNRWRRWIDKLDFFRNTRRNPLVSPSAQQEAASVKLVRRLARPSQEFPSCFGSSYASSLPAGDCIIWNVLWQCGLGADRPAADSDCPKWVEHARATNSNSTGVAGRRGAELGHDHVSERRVGPAPPPPRRAAPRAAGGVKALT